MDTGPINDRQLNEPHGKTNHSRRKFLRALVGFGAVAPLASCHSLDLSKYHEERVVATYATLIAAHVLASNGDRDVANGLFALSQALAAAGIIAHYQASQRQRQFALRQQPRIMESSKYRRSRYVAVDTERPKHTPERTLTGAGRKLEEAQVEDKARKPGDGVASHLMVLDTRKQKLRDTTVYEVASPIKGQLLKIGKDKVIYAGL